VKCQTFCSSVENSVNVSFFDIELSEGELTRLLSRVFCVFLVIKPLVPTHFEIMLGKMYK
jgi:hypothetical protein